ncbi:MAG: TetR family transcriptional regulator [Candidatus Nanopelagicales bacterium]|nr:TetR family transcriptional regulator [Candidatus Nanopelagicales bacterium]
MPSKEPQPVGPGYGEGREALLRAVVTVVARGGLRALTYRAVADEAGVTHGLVRHHFGSRDALIVAATEYSLAPALEVTHLGDTGSLDTWAKDVPRVLTAEEELTAFQYEVILESRRRPELRDAVRQLYSGFREAALADLLAHGVQADKALAIVLFAALDGLMFQGLALKEPRTTRSAIVTLRELLRAAKLAE